MLVNETAELPERRTSEGYNNERRRSSVARSLAEAAKRRTPKLGRRKTSNKVDINGDNAQISLGDRFFSLPVEIQLISILHLSLEELFACRLVSRQFNELICANESEIVRECTKRYLPPLCRDLFPEIDEIRSHQLIELYRMRRRCAVSKKLANQLIDFIELEIMRRNTPTKRETFKWDRIRLFRRFTPLIFVIYHFLERWRSLIKEKRPEDDDESKDRINSRFEEQRDLAASYDPYLLTEANSMYHFIITSVMRILRPPSYATSVEKAFRNWHPPTFNKRDVCNLMAIGGIAKLTEILNKKSLSSRARALTEFGTSVSCPHPISCEERMWPKGPYLATSRGLEPVRSAHQVVCDQPPYFPSTVSPGIWDEIVPKVLMEHGLQDDDMPVFKGTKLFLTGHLGYDIVAALRRTDGSPTWRPDARSTIYCGREDIAEGEEETWVDVAVWRTEAEAPEQEATDESADDLGFQFFPPNAL